MLLSRHHLPLGLCTAVPLTFPRTPTRLQQQDPLQQALPSFLLPSQPSRVDLLSLSLPPPTLSLPNIILLEGNRGPLL